MLYQAIDSHMTALTPARLTAEFLQHWFSAPLSPASYTPMGRAVAAGFELFERITRPYTKPEFDLNETMIAGIPVKIDEKIVTEQPFCRLLHFKRDLPGKLANRADDPRVLVVAPMSGHYATLLRGTVEAMLPDHDVFITDWIDARQVPIAKGKFTLDHYIAYLIDFLRILGPNTHVVAVCQPSPAVMAATALLAADRDPATPASMTLMGGPIDTRINPTEVCEFASQHTLEWFERTLIHTLPAYYPGFMRRVYPGFLQLSGFISMNPDRHLESHVGLFMDLVRGDGDSAQAHRKFYDEYLSVMDLSGEFYLDTVKAVFHEHQLPRGTFRHQGEKVDLRAIEQTGLMTIEGAKDDISGPGQTFAAHELCPRIAKGARGHLLHPEVGHFGIFNGRRWRQDIYPQLRDFIRSRNR